MSKKRLVTLILSIGIFLSLAATVFAACLLYTSIQTVTDAIRYVGVDDNTLALFENQYSVQPMGVSYNSYAVSYTHLDVYKRQAQPRLVHGHGQAH